MKRIKPIEIKNDCGRWIISLIRRPYSSMMEGEGACWRDFILVDYFESRIRKLECARAARALPFVFSQKEAKRAAGRSPRPPHGTSAAGSIDARWNPFGETPKNSLPHGAQTIWALVFSGRAGKATPALPLKIPSRATQ